MKDNNEDERCGISMKTAVQQIMLGSVSKSEKEALSTLKTIKDAGYDGIELNGFMIRPTSFLVRTLTKFAGMPTGRGGKYDWKELVSEAGLKVAGVHEDLGTIERETDRVIREAKEFGTEYVIVTGMYRFDYCDEQALSDLCNRLNDAGRKLSEEGISLLYHNHNIEFQKVRGLGISAYEYIIANTNERYLNFEFDSFWPAESGVSPIEIMDMLGTRMKLYHITDRGTRLNKLPMTPILKSDCMELGTGNMNLDALLDKAKANGVETVILESHRNWIDKSPISSLKKSAEYLKAYLSR